MVIECWESINSCKSSQVLVATRQLALTMMMSCTLTGRCFHSYEALTSKRSVQNLFHSLGQAKGTPSFNVSDFLIPRSRTHLIHATLCQPPLCYYVIINHPLKIMISGHWGHHKECNNHVKHKCSTCNNYFLQHLEKCKVQCRNFWTKIK